jgi:hypothetical protein
VLTLIKVLHTVVWSLFVLCILGVFVAAHRERFRLAGVLIAVVMGEVMILVANHLRCPLTGVAARYTNDRAENFDIYLPLWLAKYNKEIFGTLFALGIVYTVIRWIA